MTVGYYANANKIKGKQTQSVLKKLKMGEGHPGSRDLTWQEKEYGLWSQSLGLKHWLHHFWILWTYTILLTSLSPSVLIWKMKTIFTYSLEWLGRLNEVIFSVTLCVCVCVCVCARACAHVRVCAHAHAGAHREMRRETKQKDKQKWFLTLKFTDWDIHT